MLLKLLGHDESMRGDELRMKRMQHDSIMANTLMECEAWPWLRQELLRRAEVLEQQILDEASPLEGTALASARATARTFRSVVERIVEARPAAFNTALTQL